MTPESLNAETAAFLAALTPAQRALFERVEHARTETRTARKRRRGQQAIRWACFTLWCLAEQGGTQ